MEHKPIGIDEQEKPMWKCIVCGFEYHQEQGLPEEGIPAGTPWDAIPEDWCCPDCGVAKADFEMVQIS